MSKVWFNTGTNSGLGLRGALCHGVIVALLVSSGGAFATQETPIQVAMDYGKATARFTLGNQRCVLVDEVIRCQRAVVDLDIPRKPNH